MANLNRVASRPLPAANPHNARQRRRGRRRRRAQLVTNSGVSQQEFLHPAELWRESGRWDEFDETTFRLRDRRGGDSCFATTHEEVFTAIGRAELVSFRQRPQYWYQIGLEFRDEPRPRSGLLRVREFQTKDAYWFDLDTASLDPSVERMPFVLRTPAGADKGHSLHLVRLHRQRLSAMSPWVMMGGPL